MEAQYTPRPWKIEESKKIDSNRVWRICDSAGYTITRFTGDPKDPFTQDGANARLIAAAPDLLEALKTLLEFSHNVNDAAEQDAREAIAKATAA
jgi:hypothetical protein